MKRIKLAILSLLTILTFIQPAWAENLTLMKAKQMGLVGEQLDGMIGIVTPPGSQKLIELKEKVNAYRLSHYKELARKSGKTVGEVRLEFGRNLTAASGPGFYIKDQTGQWHLQ